MRKEQFSNIDRIAEIIEILSAANDLWYTQYFTQPTKKIIQEILGITSTVTRQLTILENDLKKAYKENNVNE